MKSLLRFATLGVLQIAAMLVPGLILVAPPLLAQVPPNSTAAVSLEVIDRSAMETHPFQNLIDWGEFRVARTGDTNLPLSVYLRVAEGTARHGVDYELVGQYLDEPKVGPGTPVVIPRGLSSVTVRLYPIDDAIHEGTETATIALSPPPASAPLTLPYSIDPTRAAGAFVILDNDPAPSGIQITRPLTGSHFSAGASIQIEAVAADPAGYISAIEFLANGRVIGQSRVLFIREPDPGTPIQHQFVWLDAPRGSQTLTAQGRSSSGASFVSEPVTITVDADSAKPIVSLATLHSPEKTSEPCPVCRIVPGVFTLTRSGPTNEPLEVYLEADGTATPGPADATLAILPDYQALPHRVTIPAGTNTAYVSVFPFDDQLVEGPEIVRARLDRPPDVATLGYVVDANASQAMVVIGDDEPDAPEARLDLIEPRDGAQFPQFATMVVTALGVFTQGEIDRGVEFFADGVLIGKTPPLNVDRRPIPCLPSVHTIVWTNPPPGRHTLTARSEIGPNQVVQAPPVHVLVGDPPPPEALVSIEATRMIAEETSFPFRRLAFRGEFTIARSGPTNASTTCFVLFDGTAKPDSDYPAQPFVVTIPAGAVSTTIEIVPKVDNQTEGIETVVARLSHCPPVTVPPLGMPCFGGFEIDPARASAVVYIRDDGLTRTSVHLTRPASGTSFAQGEPIAIDAEAFDVEGSVHRVEFLANGKLIGESILLFIRPSAPGEINTFSIIWRNADPGDYILTAIAHNDGATSVTSAPVSIRVGPSSDVPVVTIAAADAFAVEPHTAGEVNTASFRIQRTGPTNGDLTVNYSLHGTAIQGVDYETLPGSVVIPRGRRSVLITATPIADDVRERFETVVMQLEPRPAGDPSASSYRIGTRSRAAALIADQPWVHPVNGAVCERLPGDFAHLCFAADGFNALAVEASEDLHLWQILGEASPADGALHFIDQDIASFPQRFYRIRPVPASAE